ncbi:hypothetical protein GCM10010495_76690 [Kitasatospora herbaricolor]|uniref:hypothetical protein n=1 Tax=Kitasatospora herbaricolor TaxID=68217 RepID=UPI00174BBDED|nr:hypothetical protein [Kitasatospora herbaricolor]MDQ0305516.1 hypothetical protein [Kitasatospora herbaricolor]GGV47658.1 hypothetical protein GCM10010495_76690 [Kitasatospora herbaricolor]
MTIFNENGHQDQRVPGCGRVSADLDGTWFAIGTVLASFLALVAIAVTIGLANRERRAAAALRLADPAQATTDREPRPISALKEQLLARPERTAERVAWLLCSAAGRLEARARPGGTGGDPQGDRAGCQGRPLGMSLLQPPGVCTFRRTWMRRTGRFLWQIDCEG